MQSGTRAFAADQNVVTEGRDHGTLVFPERISQVLFDRKPPRRGGGWLNIKPGVNRQLSSRCKPPKMSVRRDAARTIAPMKPAADATRSIRQDQTVDEVVALWRTTSRPLAAKPQVVPELWGVLGEQQIRKPRPRFALARAGRGCPRSQIRRSRRPAGGGSKTRRGGDERVRGRAQQAERSRDRSLAQLFWYRFVQYLMATLTTVIIPWRATGQSNLPAAGGVLLVSNHASFADVFFVGIPLHRPLNYVARSTLFVPVLASFMRSVGELPIQREGMGASGLKETLRRLRNGGIVTLFPEGTRSWDGRLGPVKPGIAVLVARAKVPVVPVGLAGTFEVWPRSRLLPAPHPVRVHYGAPIFPEELAGMDNAAVTGLIRQRLEDCHREAERALKNDMRI